MMIKVNKYFMEKYADYRTPSFVRKVTRPSNIWTRGVYYEGLMSLYSIFPAQNTTIMHTTGLNTMNGVCETEIPHVTLMITAVDKLISTYIIFVPSLKC